MVGKIENGNLSDGVCEGICSVTKNNLAKHCFQVWKSVTFKYQFCFVFIFVLQGKVYQCDHSLQTLLTLPGAVDLQNEESTVQQ